MFKRFKIFASIASLLILASCDDLRDSYLDCGVWLEFVFDHNMDRADSFGRGMDTVDVLVFDADGKFYTDRRAMVADLDGRKRMFLGDPDMPFGEYSVITMAGLTDHFELSDMSGGGVVRGVTTIDEVRHALLYDDPENVNHYFPHLWFGSAVKIDYKADLSVWQVPVIRQTNNVSVAYTHTLTETETIIEPESSTTRQATAPLHIVEIITPESGAYDRWNEPIAHDQTVYRPHTIASDRRDVTNGEVKASYANLNTMRLLADHPAGYTLDIHESQTGGLVMRADLIDLLSRTKPEDMTLQEYLDRQGEWNIVLEVTTTKEKEIIREVGDPPPPPDDDPDPPGPPAIVRSDYIALRIVVNDWVLWENSVGI